MSPAEFVLLLPLLWLGVSAKATELRVRPAMRAMLFAAAFAASPIVVAAALLRLPDMRARRLARLSQRRVDDFWLLRRIVAGGSPHTQQPVGLVWDA